jgi:hypothetical protein
VATDKLGQSISYLDYTDKPDLFVMGGAIVDGLTQRAVMRFANATSRDATIASPVAGMIAWLTSERLFTGFDGSSWVALAAGTQAWTTPTLATGYTPDGNSNGVPKYRIVNFFGDQVVMWKGGYNVTYSGGLPAHSGDMLLSALPSAAWPTSRRTVTAACSAVSSNSLSVKVDFNPDGTTSLITETGVQPPWVSLNGLFYSLTA